MDGGKGVGREGWMTNGHKETFRGNGYVIFIVVMVLKVHTYVKTHANMNQQETGIFSIQSRS